MTSWFRGLKAQLLLVAILPLIGFTLVFFVALHGMNQINHIADIAHREIIPNAQYMGEMRQSRNKFLYQSWATLADHDNPESLKKRLGQVQESMEEFKTFYQKYVDGPKSKEERFITEKIQPIMPQFFREMEGIVTVLKNGDYPKARELLGGEFAKLGALVRDFNRDVARVHEKIVDEESKSAQKTRSTMFLWLVSITSVAGLGILIGLLTIASRLSANVGHLSNQLTGTGAQVTTSVDQLHQAGSTLASASSQAAASLEETVASLEEVSSMVQINSNNAKEAAALSVVSKNSAEKGEAEMKLLIQSMVEISQSSRKIEEIIQVIDDIAFQTNLLALNAAVESARAGEQGKGFAVVADAVRGLAQRSAEAAKDISELIRTSVAQIEQGRKTADRSEEVLQEIVHSVKKVSDLNAEIATASSEQSGGIQQINQAMNQLDQVVQSNASSAEEIAATGNEIRSLALTSQNLSADLKLLVLGRTKVI